MFSGYIVREATVGLEEDLRTTGKLVRCLNVDQISILNVDRQFEANGRGNIRFTQKVYYVDAFSTLIK